MCFTVNILYIDLTASCLDATLKNTVFTYLTLDQKDSIFPMAYTLGACMWTMIKPSLEQAVNNINDTRAVSKTVFCSIMTQNKFI